MDTVIYCCTLLNSFMISKRGISFAEVMQATDLSSSMESLTYETSSLSSPTNSSTMGTTGGISQQQHQQTRTKRMRTSFKHHQLRTMKSYFNINQNPDAKDLKQLAQKTGLSKRVLQVRRDGLSDYVNITVIYVDTITWAWRRVSIVHRFGFKTLEQSGEETLWGKKTTKWWPVPCRTRTRLRHPTPISSGDTPRPRRV